MTHLVLLAISSRLPGSEQVATEVPESNAAADGLSDLKRAWITVSEYGCDIAEWSFSLDANGSPLGRVSRSFVSQLAAAVSPLVRAGQARIDRTD
ncbi:MAG: hypothetical protein U1E24_13315 [Phenylobacterium sp.]|nr:hypothetical protein [Phenylobacterium sp.]